MHLGSSSLDEQFSTILYGAFDRLCCAFDMEHGSIVECIGAEFEKTEKLVLELQVIRLPVTRCSLLPVAACCRGILLL